MRQRDLTVLPPGCKDLSYDECKRLGILPNRIIFLPDRAVVVEAVRSARGDDYAVNVNAIKYAADVEHMLNVQGYVRGITREDGKLVWQDTIGNYLRKVNGLEPRLSAKEGYGSYHWVDANGNPKDTPNGQRRPEVNSPPWKNGD